MRSMLQTPPRVHDILPQECRLKRAAEEKLRSLFMGAGFCEVETPAYEYYDMFGPVSGGTPRGNMMKFIDDHGQVLVLRPEFTIPIARMYASKLAGPARFFYVGDVFTLSPEGMGNSQYTQAGVELIGEEGSVADAQVVALAINALLAAGLEDFTVDLGNAAYFKGLLGDMGVEGEKAELIRQNVDVKNISELERITAGMTAAESKAILGMVSLFGGRQTLERARRTAPNAECEGALDRLCGLYELLSGFGLEKYISIDLGMLHDYDYYTGVVFRGLCAGAGFPVMSGGRYDNLMGGMGKDAPAVGFAVDLSRCMQAVYGDLVPDMAPMADCAVLSDSSSADKAYAFAQGQRGRGVKTALCSGMDEEAFRAYISSNGIKTAYIFKNGAVEGITLC